MRSRYFSAVLILLVFMPSSLFAYRLNEVWEKSFDVDEDVSFILENVNGSIEVEGWNKDRIEIFAKIRVKAGSKNKAKKIFDRIEFDVDHDRDMVRVKADLPKLRKESLFGLFGGSSPSITVTYRVKVPRGAELDLVSVNGSVEASGVKGNFLLKTVNGDVVFRSGGGGGGIRTVNGSVYCGLDEFAEGAELQIKTVNGGVKVELPDDAGAELDIKTLNGKVRTNFELNRVKRIRRNRIEGEIGDGEGYIHIRTTNGGVTVRSD
ncbi:MAG: DUF4097 family beta strand repeat protein [Candidatus Krumholzibacteriota bacterium]|nr:DUF4097 family beta strand repeat protein [Candidatus Krumholzibacteriota bacterium]